MEFDLKKLYDRSVNKNEVDPSLTAFCVPDQNLKKMSSHLLFMLYM